MLLNKGDEGTHNHIKVAMFGRWKQEAALLFFLKIQKVLQLGSDSS